MTTYCAPQSGEADQTSEFINIQKAFSFNNTYIIRNITTESESKSFVSPIFSNTGMKPTGQDKGN